MKTPRRVLHTACAVHCTKPVPNHSSVFCEVHEASGMTPEVPLGHHHSQHHYWPFARAGSLKPWVGFSLIPGSATLVGGNSRKAPSLVHPCGREEYYSVRLTCTHDNDLG